jgi:hypothetical protein
MRFLFYCPGTPARAVHVLKLMMVLMMQDFTNLEIHGRINERTRKKSLIV